MKSQNPVGRAFSDVCEAFSEYFSHRITDFQLAGLLPTFGERFFARKRGKNLVRQAHWAPGTRRGSFCGALRRPRGDQPGAGLLLGHNGSELMIFTTKSSPRASQRAPENANLLRKSASKHVPQNFSGSVCATDRIVAREQLCPTASSQLTPPNLAFTFK